MICPKCDSDNILVYRDRLIPFDKDGNPLFDFMLDYNDQGMFMAQCQDCDHKWGPYA